MNATREHTIFYLCDRHAWLDGESRYRRAEFFAEGGPTDGPCRGTHYCSIRPGTDMFVAHLCTIGGEYGTLGPGPFAWKVNDPS